MELYILIKLSQLVMLYNDLVIFLAIN